MLSKLPIVDMVQVCRACNAGGKGTFDASIAFDEAANVISELAIPLTPDVPVREATYLI